MNTKEAAKPKETPFETLERLKAEASKPVVIGPELAKILTGMKSRAAA
ncbi:MAG TPA: hypothetical protein VEZ24_09435 [Microvirga sp.]|nr:hypothetical protein [Microvirga sp.]